MKLRLNWDSLGIATTLLCAIHCMVLPLLLTSLPLMGIDLIHDPVFEWSMILLAIIIGIYALYHGYIKHHRNIVPVYLFLAGAALLIVKQLFHDFQLLLLLAIPLIVVAHWKNYKLCHKSSCKSEHHKH